MVVFLQEFVFAFRRFVIDEFGIFLRFQGPFFFGHIVPTFELLLFTFASENKTNDDEENCSLSHRDSLTGRVLLDRVSIVSILAVSRRRTPRPDLRHPC